MTKANTRARKNIRDRTVKRISDRLCSLMGIVDQAEIEFLKKGIQDAWTMGRRSLDKKIVRYEQTLDFYGQAENYFAIGFIADPPSGPFIDDFSDTDFGYKPGKRARKVLGYEK